MPTVSFDDVLGLDDEFDPLMADDLEIDQEDMDDDNPLDTVDYPTMRNMPQSMQREAVYTPKRQGGVESAVLELLDHNPGRRPVLLSIMGLCRGGCAASRVAEHVEAAQASNRSVYAPMTLCRMLERAGALSRTRTWRRALRFSRSKNASTLCGAQPKKEARCTRG